MSATAETTWIIYLVIDLPLHVVNGSTEWPVILSNSEMIRRCDGDDEALAFHTFGLAAMLI